MQKIYKFKLKPYPYKISFVFFKEIKDVEKIFESLNLKIDNPENVFTSMGMCFKYAKNRYGSLILINENDVKSFNKFIKTVRHEIQHACCDCYEYICADNSELSHEPFIYLNDYVFNKLLKKGKKHYGNISKNK